MLVDRIETQIYYKGLADIPMHSATWRLKRADGVSANPEASGLETQGKLMFQALEAGGDPGPMKQASRRSVLLHMGQPVFLFYSCHQLMRDPPALGRTVCLSVP